MPTLSKNNLGHGRERTTREQVILIVRRDLTLG